MSATATNTLGQRMARGGLLLVILRLMMRGIGLISTMILFRLLVPGDFGLVSLAMTAVGFIEVLAEFGFDLALIQKQETTRADFDTAWSLTLLRGLICATLLLLIAEPAAEYLADERLSSIITWVALVPLLDGLHNIGVVEFQKELYFGKEFIYRLSQKLISFFITLGLALWFRDYWALVFGILAGRAASLGLSYLLHPFRPRVYFGNWRSILQFSQWVMLNHLFLYIGNQTDKVLIKKYIDIHTVGIFRVAEELCSVTMELVWPAEKALFPGFSKLSNDLPGMRRYLLQSLGLLGMVGMPVSIGLGVTAEPLVDILLGPKGAGVAPFIQVLTLHGAIRSCITGIPPALMAMGKPSVPTRITLATVAVRLSVLIVYIPTLGAMAAAWSLVAASAVSFVLYWLSAMVLVRVKWWQVPAALWRYVVATAVMAWAVTASGHWLNAQLAGLALPLPLDGVWWSLGEKVVVGVLSYILTTLVLWLISGMPEGAERQLFRLIQARFRPAHTS